MIAKEMRAQAVALRAQVAADRKDCKDLTEEHIKDFEARLDQADEIMAQADRLDRLDARVRDGQAAAASVPLTPGVSPIDTRASASKDPLAFGKMIQAIHARATGIRAAVSDFSLGAVGEDGGYLIPIDQRMELQSTVLGPGRLLSSLITMPTSGRVVTFPIDQEQVYDASRLDAEWLAEGVAPTIGKILKLSQASVTMRACKVLVAVSDELLSDVPALQAYVTNKLSAKLGTKIEAAVMLGSQTSETTPHGILSAANGIEIDPEDGQTDDFVEKNFLNMMEAMTDESFNRAFWLMNRRVKFALATLEDGNGNRLYNTGSMQSQLLGGQLYGRPIVTSLYSPAITAAGDVQLIDPASYSLWLRQGIEQAMSVDFAFDQGLSVFRATVWIGGKPLFDTITLPDNTTVGGLVRLGSRE
jgi:HK97 family phage major capsid protein